MTVHVLQVVVGFSQFLIFPTEGEARWAVLDCVFHFGNHHSQIFNFSLEMMRIEVSLSGHVFPLVSLLEGSILFRDQQIQGLFQPGVLCSHFQQTLLKVLICLAQFPCLSEEFLNLSSQLLYLLLLTLDEQFRLIEPNLIILQFHLQEVIVSFLLFDQFGSLSLEIFQFIPQKLFKMWRKSLLVRYSGVDWNL